MNRRIHPDDLQHAPYHELIQTLTNQWVERVPPANGMSYELYAETIAILLLTTQNPDRTTEIVKAVLTQAVALNKTAYWVQQEIKFEGMIDGADRTDFLRLDLSQTPTIDDPTLDLYNERIKRFSDSD